MKLWKAAAPLGAAHRRSRPHGALATLRRNLSGSATEGARTGRLPGASPLCGTDHDPGARHGRSKRDASLCVRDGARASAGSIRDRDRRCRAATCAPPQNAAARAACRARRPAWCRSPATTCRCSIADGIIAEHNHVRTQAGLFDVSHMGQAFLVGADHETVARALEALVPADIVNLAPGRQRYTQFTDDERRHPRRPDGDALGRPGRGRRADAGRQRREQGGGLRAPVGAAARRRAADPRRSSRAGRRAGADGALRAVGRHCPEAVPMPFMSAITTRFDGIDCHISRSGYTGEDGFEISCKATRVRAIAERLLSEPSVKLIGLGARDSLRLEAGLCLYGHDIDATTSPVEAALTWSIRSGAARKADFPARSASSARSRRGRRAGASASSRRAARPRAKAPRSRGRRRRRSARSRPAASGRPSTARSRWAMSTRASPRPARRCAHRARQADAGERRRAAVRAASLCPESEEGIDDHALHQGP